MLSLRFMGCTVVLVLVAGCSSSLIGREYLTPAPAQAVPTATSQAQDLSALSVEFVGTGKDVSGLSTLLPQLVTALEVRDGWLRMRGVPEEAGWYSDRSGPFVYHLVTGNFMAETRVQTHSIRAEGTRPVGKFNSTGLLARDPSSRKENMRWVMHNIGMQEKFYGTEAKNTVPHDGSWHLHRLAGFKSLSTLYLTPVKDSVLEATLRMCRVGNEFRFFTRLVGETQWREEAHTAGTVVQGNGAGRPTAGTAASSGPIRFVRADMPATVQVGLISNPGISDHDGESRFDYLRFSRIADFAACIGS